MDLVPFNPRERYTIYGAALAGCVFVRIPSRKTIAGGVRPGTEMRETHAVIESEAAGDLPGIRRVKLRRDVAERRGHVEILFRIGRHLTNEHVRVGVATGVPCPTGEPHRAIDCIIAGLLVPSPLPVKTELGGVRFPNLNQ